ncbi:hypothetical protein BLA29_007444 [Euroglyphus maynei]|uniref:Uncharacterized protein n=1 Tax=Euroglyphus maynei TaxID=6958 RepID=A0A1Y3AMA4_EURMA|nr:hypothetical protein BLA29_007444 [Euroglyphus maynei]
MKISNSKISDRPPSQSLNSYGHGIHDDVRSPNGSTGTPGPLSQQPSSQQSTDNNSEAGMYCPFFYFSYFNPIRLLQGIMSNQIFTCVNPLFKFKRLLFTYHPIHG